jgi:hypothetical protein
VPLPGLEVHKHLVGGKSMLVVVVEGMSGMLLDMVGMVVRGLLARVCWREAFRPGRDRTVDERARMDPGR